MEKFTGKKEFTDYLIKLASEDADFRDKLLSNPKEVVEGILKFPLPDGYEIAVHQDTSSKINLVLPIPADELSEVELSAVAGGGCYGTCHTDTGK